MTTPTNPKPLPCPFCGTVPRIEMVHPQNHDKFLRCKPCGIGWFTLAAWNTRADGDADKRRLDWLEKQRGDRVDIYPHGERLWRRGSAFASNQQLFPTLRAAIDSALSQDNQKEVKPCATQNEKHAPAIQSNPDTVTQGAQSTVASNAASAGPIPAPAATCAIGLCPTPEECSRDEACLGEPPPFSPSAPAATKRDTKTLYDALRKTVTFLNTYSLAVLEGEKALGRLLVSSETHDNLIRFGREIEAALKTSTTPPPMSAAVYSAPSKEDGQTPRRPHLVKSAGYWYNGAHEKQRLGQHADATFAMENAYNHVENALYAAREDLARAEQALREAEQALAIIGERAICDWDDKTVGEVDVVVKEPTKYKDFLKDVFDVAKERDSLRAQLADAQRERDELAAWKASAMTVMAPLQEIGQAMELPLGSSIHDKILPYITAIRANLTASRQECERLRGNIHARDMEIESLKIDRQHRTEDRDRLKERVAELEKALAARTESASEGKA